jgi:phage FluMu gp28-like protein
MKTLLYLLTLMPAILPAITIDSSKADLRFMPHQRVWIADDSRMRLAEKSVRIGWTYADAFKNVRKRLHHARRDYLFATKDQASAVEYMGTCQEFCELYKLTKMILSHGEDSVKVPVLRDGKDSGFTEEVKFCYIKFDNGSRIIAFSSNPNAMLVYGGDVGLDEFAAHPQQDKLWETAQGRITMGYDIGVWSAHKGVDTLFYEFAREARAGRGGWSYYKVTMEDAIDLGYLDMLFARTGKRWTKEEFLEDCRRRARLDDIYEQAYNCNPRGGTMSAVAWSVIELCQKDYTDYERAHLEAKAVKERFGKFTEASKTRREATITSWLANTFPQTLARRARHTLGFDVAASGQGDLGAIYVDEKDGGKQVMRALLTFRTEDWHFIETAARWFMGRTTDVTGCGDETGLGRQICWTLAQAFPNRFTPVNFSGEKHDMGFELISAMATDEKHWPAKEQDIAMDYFALRKEFQGGRWRFSEGPNVLNSESHCDIAWAGALSRKAAGGTGPFAWSPAGSSTRGTLDSFDAGEFNEASQTRGLGRILKAAGRRIFG